MRNCTGRHFHKAGAVRENARFPNVVVLDEGTSRRLVLDDRVLRWEIESRDISRSERYCGASPFSDLNVRSRILYSIRFETGSQWSSIRIGVIWLYTGVRVSIRAAMCNILWRRPS